MHGNFRNCSGLTITSSAIVWSCTNGKQRWPRGITDDTMCSSDGYSITEQRRPTTMWSMLLERHGPFPCKIRCDFSADDFRRHWDWARWTSTRTSDIAGIGSGWDRSNIANEKNCTDRQVDELHCEWWSIQLTRLWQSRCCFCRRRTPNRIGESTEFARLWRCCFFSFFSRIHDENESHVPIFGCMWRRERGNTAISAWFSSAVHKWKRWLFSREECWVIGSMATSERHRVGNQWSVANGDS